MMTWVWVGAVLTSAAIALWNGNAAAVAAAAAQGSAAAVDMGIRMLGGIMLWSGVMEVMDRSGLTKELAALLRPVLGRLFPAAREDPALSEALGCNMSANLLGLGNAATPAGIRAAVRLKDRGDETQLTRLVVLNTASVQLFPATVAALRFSLGSVDPYDILPAVWLTSLLSVSVGLAAERLLRRS